MKNSRYSLLEICAGCSVSLMIVCILPEYMASLVIVLLVGWYQAWMRVCVCVCVCVCLFVYVCVCVCVCVLGLCARLIVSN